MTSSTKTNPPLPPPQPPAVTFDPAQVAEFLRFLLDPAVGCVEMRIFGAWRSHKSNFIEPANRQTIVLSGWYDTVDSLVAESIAIRHVSAYVTVNPVQPDLLCRARNKLIQAKQGNSTSDENIVCHRWIYIDCDSARPDGISATQEERTAALALRDRILSEFPFLHDSAIWGSSGNGGWILVRLADMPNDGTNGQTYILIGRILSGLAERFGKKGRAGDAAFVDEKTKNASRVMCLPGTLKCKGENDRRRPWRLATIEGVVLHYGQGRVEDNGAAVLGRGPGWQPVPVDLDAWAALLPEVKASGLNGHSQGGQVNRNGHVAAPGASHQRRASSTTGKPVPPPEGVYDPAWAEYRCRKAIFGPNFQESIAGMEGHKALFHAAAMIWSDFGLTDAVGFGLFEEWNRTMASPPEDERQVRHKWEDVAKVKGTPSLTGYWADRQESSGATATATGTHGVNCHATATESEIFCPPGMEENPDRLARLVIAQRFTHPDGLKLRYWRDEFFAWNGAHYYRIPRREMAAEVHRIVDAEAHRLWEIALMAHAMKNRGRAPGNEGDGSDGGDQGEQGKRKMPRPFPVTTRVVGDVIQAISGIVLVKEKEVPSQPVWFDRASDWNPVEVLPARNALVHLPTFAESQQGIRKPTPLFFSPFAVGYDFNRDASTPVNWLKFLGSLPVGDADDALFQLWPDDLESIMTLQEWMGYLLTPDTSQQKILMLIGPRRAGKGVITRIIRALIGPDNVGNPTLSGLASNFGLAPLIGKPAAIISDARISGRTDTAAVIERLLFVSGEDSITIDRKHKESVEEKLSTRFMLVSNELPKLRDAAGALSGRMIFLQLTNSFFGREDPTLIDKLLPELPGILLWAIEGWKRLRDRGHFVTPRSALELARVFEDITSPVKAFIRDCCRVEISETCQVPTADLFNRWRWWCESKGYDFVGIEEEFGRNLRAAVSHVKKTRPRQGDKRTWVYKGIRLLEEWEYNKDEADGEDGHDEEESENGVVQGTLVPF